MLPDNEVDGMALMHLTNSDINMMLPGKVGTARKITVVIEQLKSSQNLPVNVVTEDEARSKSAHSNTTSQTSSVAANEVDLHVAASTSGLGHDTMLSQDVIGPTCSNTMPLPAYSTRIKDVLNKGNVLLDFDLFIEETAFHIIANGDMVTKDAYEQFGRRLLTAYPCLEFPGKKTTWVHQCHVLLFINFFVGLVCN